MSFNGGKHCQTNWSNDPVDNIGQHQNKGKDN
jgi:hypothetical protein